ncbi:hypothetical protein [Cupriavidus sp. HMR-1]|uniref:hypothetical protein n=1 Tax=Cupriavidus sp. HMR-1 TaxID=1249621 RepID=UPI0012675327|nr:hypothetical protein [Cupriavidus sp. HMR-1]
MNRLISSLCLLAILTLSGCGSVEPAKQTVAPVDAGELAAGGPTVTIEEAYSLLGGMPSAACAGTTCVLTAPGRDIYRCADGVCTKGNAPTR